MRSPLRDVSGYRPRKARSGWSIPAQGWPQHFDATARHVDAEFDAATVRGHWRRTRHEAAARLVGSGAGALLEIGAGSGRLLAELAGRGWSVTGIDPAPAMVEITRSRLPDAGERITVAQAESLPFDNESFEVVVSVGVLGFVDVEPSLGEIARVVRPGGRAVLGVFNGHAPTIAWQRHVVHPAARAVKRVVPFGRPLPWSHRSFTRREARRLLARTGMHVELAERVGCAVLLDPLDRLAPGLAWRAARTAERHRQLRRMFGTQYILVARRPSPPVL